MPRFTPIFNSDGQGGGEVAPVAQQQSYADFFRSLPEPGDEYPDDPDSDGEEYEETDEQDEQETDDGGADGDEDNDDDTDADEDGEDSEESDGDTDEGEADAPAFDDETEIDLGEGRQPVKLSELKKGYLRQSDYTKKAQELAIQRKDVEAQAEALKPAQEFAAHMEANPWLWGQVKKAIEEFNTTGILPMDEVMQDQQYGKYINRLMAENNRLTKELAGLSGELEGAKLSSALSKLQSDLRTEYGDLVTDEFMTKLQERGKTEKLSPETLREIADGQLAKEKLKTNQTNVKKATKKAEAKAAQKLAETRKKAPAAPKQTSTKPDRSEEIDPNESWADFLRRTAGL